MGFTLMSMANAFRFDADRILNREKQDQLYQLHQLHTQREKYDSGSYTCFAKDIDDWTRLDLPSFSSVNLTYRLVLNEHLGYYKECFGEPRTSNILLKEKKYPMDDGSYRIGMTDINNLEAFVDTYEEGCIYKVLYSTNFTPNKEKVILNIGNTRSKLKR